MISARGIDSGPITGYPELMLPFWEQIPERQHQFRVARNPSRVDAMRGDHFLQADFTGRIPPSRPDSFRFADNSQVDPPLRTEGVVIMLWPITYRSSEIGRAHV